MTTKTNAKYIVNGIDCTTGEKKQLTFDSIEEAREEMESWLGWFNYYKPTRKLNGSDADFYIEEEAKNGLTAYNDQNAREIEMMMGKAMCAYANWMVARECMLEDINKGFEAEPEKHRALVAHKSEYEATVRCIDMFVRESVYEIQMLVIERSKEELGI